LRYQQRKFTPFFFFIPAPEELCREWKPHYFHGWLVGLDGVHQHLFLVNFSLSSTSSVLCRVRTFSSSILTLDDIAPLFPFLRPPLPFSRAPLPLPSPAPSSNPRRLQSNESRRSPRRYNIEPTSGEAGYFDGTGYGNWSPGPWRKLVDKTLPWVFKMTPDTLYQVRPGARPSDTVSRSSWIEYPDERAS
jgi:hypothetical protein